MTRDARVHAAAHRELEDAARWYERQRPGLGAAFLAEVNHAIGRAAQAPMHFAAVHKDVRCVRLRRFPYSVFFRPDERGIFVLAVFHARRSPGVWQNRER